MGDEESGFGRKAYALLNDRIDQLSEELVLTKQRLPGGARGGGERGGMALGGVTPVELAAAGIAAEKAEACAQRAEESIATAAKAGRDLGAAMDGAGALLKGVMESVESAGAERRKLEAAVTSTRTAQDAVIAATTESLHRVQATADEAAVAATRRAESGCRAAASKATAACEEKCLAAAHEEMDRVVAKRIEKELEAAVKRQEGETVAQYHAQKRDLELKADQMLESMVRRACDVASTRAEGAAKEAAEAARKCNDATDARARAEAATVRAEAAAVEAKEAKAWLTHQVSGFVRATEEGIVALRDQEMNSVARLATKGDEAEARVRVVVAEAEARCQETGASATRVEATLKRALGDVESAESINTRLGAVEARAEGIARSAAAATTAAAEVRSDRVELVEEMAAARRDLEDGIDRVSMFVSAEVEPLAVQVVALQAAIFGVRGTGGHGQARDVPPETPVGAGDGRKRGGHESVPSPTGGWADASSPGGLGTPGSAAFANWASTPDGGGGIAGGGARSGPSLDGGRQLSATSPIRGAGNEGGSGGGGGGEGIGRGGGLSLDNSRQLNSNLPIRRDGGAGSSGYPLVMQVVDIAARVDAIATALESIRGDDKNRTAQVAAVSAVHTRVEQTAAAVKQLHAAVGNSLKERPTASAVRALIVEANSSDLHQRVTVLEVEVERVGSEASRSESSAAGALLPLARRATAAEEAAVAVGRRVAMLEDAQREAARQHRRVQRVVDDVRDAVDARNRADEAGSLRKLRSEGDGDGGRDGGRSHGRRGGGSGGGGSGGVDSRDRERASGGRGGMRREKGNRRGGLDDDNIGDPSDGGRGGDGGSASDSSNDKVMAGSRGSRGGRGSSSGGFSLDGGRQISAAQPISGGEGAGVRGRGTRDDLIGSLAGASLSTGLGRM